MEEEITPLGQIGAGLALGCAAIGMAVLLHYSPRWPVLDFLFVVSCFWLPKFLKERIWNALPDRCIEAFCSRKGIRGQESLVDGRRYCGYCCADAIRKWLEIKHALD